MVAVGRGYLTGAEVIPQDPARAEYGLGHTLGDERKHWCGARFYQHDRLFFRYHLQALVHPQKRSGGCLGRCVPHRRISDQHHDVAEQDARLSTTDIPPFACLLVTDTHTSQALAKVLGDIELRCDHHFSLAVDVPPLA